MKKRLLFDLSATQPQFSRYHGGGEYAKALFERLVVRRDECENIWCYYDPKREFDESILKLAQNSGINLIPYQKLHDIPVIANKLHIDRVYSALPYTHKDLRFGSIEFVCTIHGLRSIEIPTDKYEIFYWESARDIFRYVVKNLFQEKYLRFRKSQIRELFSVSDTVKVVVPSLHTKFALMNHFPELDQRHVRVLYSPRHPSTSPAACDLSKQFGVQQKDFYLLVSTDRWTKNSCRALFALDSVLSQHPEITKNVLCLGVSGEKIREKLRGYVANKERFVFHDYVDRSTLELLYKSAFCFIYPTLNEGFGYPPLECMKYGTPVIGSAITSVPEICQDAVLYFNPFSIEELKNRILQMTCDEGVYKKYADRGPGVFKEVSSKQDAMLDELVSMILS